MSGGHWFGGESWVQRTETVCLKCGELLTIEIRVAIPKSTARHPAYRAGAWAGALLASLLITALATLSVVLSGCAGDAARAPDADEQRGWMHAVETAEQRNWVRECMKHGASSAYGVDVVYDYCSTAAKKLFPRVTP